MRTAVKEKVTVSLDPTLVDVVDHEVRVHRVASRSAVVEGALRLWRKKGQVLHSNISPARLRRWHGHCAWNLPERSTT